MLVGSHWGQIYNEGILGAASLVTGREKDGESNFDTRQNMFLKC